MKTIVINFESFGFYTKTTISFCRQQGTEVTKIEFNRCDVDVIVAAIKGIINLTGIDKAFYITSTKLMNSIKQRTLNDKKSLHELFCEKGIEIQEVKK